VRALVLLAAGALQVPAIDGATTLDGRMVDRPHLARAERLLRGCEEG